MTATGHEPLVQGWFRVEALDQGVFAIEEPLHDENVKSHLVVGTDRALLIDTGMGVGDISAVVGGLTDRPLTVLNSHAHWDHVGGNGRFPASVDIVAHLFSKQRLATGTTNERLRDNFSPERVFGPFPDGFRPATIAYPPTHLDRLLRGGEVIDLGGRLLEVIHAPGHAPDLLVVLDRAAGILFSTDAVYAGALYAQLPGSDLRTYRDTMATLAALAPSLRRLYPSHGPVSLDPAILPRMRLAFDAVGGGRTPDRWADGVATHLFPDFSILVAASAVTARAS